MSDYRQLTVWQKARALALRSYRATDGFPRTEEYGLKSQIRRAAVSIPANIAEGSGRHSDRDFIRFVRISGGSASELECLLLIAGDLEYVGQPTVESVGKDIREVRRMLAGLARRLGGG